SVTEILAHAHHRLIEGKASFDADDGEVERVGHAEADAGLAVIDFAFEEKARDEKSESGYAQQERRGFQSADESDGQETDHRKEYAHALIDGYVALFAVAGLNEPGAGAVRVVGRKRKRLAEWIESLLNALLDGRLLLHLRPVPTQRTQAGPDDRRWS